MSDLAKQLGKRVYLFRKRNGLTQAALAEKVKISNEFMSGIERGAKLPSLFTLEKIAQALEVTPKDLFNFDRTGFQSIQSLSREVLDVSALLQKMTPSQRRKISKVVKVLAESDRD